MMKRLLFILLLTTIQITYMSAQKQADLIDREIFFGNSEISAGQLSPDGNFVSFLKEHDGIMNIYVKEFNQKFEEAKLLTASKSPILGFFWTYDAKYILYVNDNDGDENLNIFSVDPRAEAEGLVPPSKNLTPLKEVTAQIYQVSRKNPDIIMLGLNDRDKAWHDLYRLEISTGKLTKEFENTDRITGWDFDWDEKPRLATRNDENGESQIMKIVGPGKFETIYQTNLQESAYVNSWNSDNSKCYLVSNKGDVDLSTLYMMDPETGDVEKIESDRNNKVDFGGMMVNRNTREIIYTQYTLDKTKRYWRDKVMEADFKYLETQFPGREIFIVSSTIDYQKMLISVSGDKYATDVYFFDRSNKELIFQYTPKPKLKEVEDRLATMEPINYKSSDGLDIPAYLSTPTGVAAKNLPLVVLVHGGPKGPRDYWGYDATAQFLANRGYAVLQPNFRASGGFGKNFLNAGDKQWGKLMQDDITWGVKHLISTGIVDKDRVAIMGGSYGGYATLAGMAFTPEVYACGVDIVGPSNLFTLLESIPAYWEAGRKWLYEMTGDPDTPEGQKLIKEASPLFHADKIQNPLLIIQGANDPRVKKAEADQIVIAMRERNKEVSYLLAEDEGHGFRKPLNRMAMYADVERFLSENLGGRYQETMPDDVKETLEKLKVDINSVTYDPKPKVGAIQELPKMNSKITAGSQEFDVALDMGGNEMKMNMTRTIEAKGEQWVITDKTSGAMGEATDQATFDKNMKIVSRKVSQQGMDIPMSYDGNKMSLSAMGNDIEIEADGLMFSESIGMNYILSGLGLKNGEQTAIYVGDMMTAKAKQLIVNYLGKDAFNGKDYDKFMLVSSENENETYTYWIDPVTQMSAKIENVIPAMNNAKMTVIAK